MLKYYNNRCRRKSQGKKAHCYLGESFCDGNKHQNAVFVKSVKSQGCNKGYLLTLALWFLTIQLRFPDKALGSLALMEKLFTCYCYRNRKQTYKHFLHLNDLIFHESSHNRLKRTYLKQ